AMKQVFKAATAILIGMGLAGCIKPKAEFYAIDVHDIDEKTPQTRAMIRLSDPQVFSRDAMINDRIKERDHLESLLKESTGTKLNFEPQLAREFSGVSAFAAQLGVSANPAAGLKFRSEVDE